LAPEATTLDLPLVLLIALTPSLVVLVGGAILALVRGHRARVDADRSLPRAGLLPTRVSAGHNRR